eukprot:553057-Pleurochrysis_carterae.AAC.2
MCVYEGVSACRRARVPARLLRGHFSGKVQVLEPFRCADARPPSERFSECPWATVSLGSTGCARARGRSWSLGSEKGGKGRSVGWRRGRIWAV